jgi:hypothetical protein
MPLVLFQMDDIIEATIDSEHSAPNSPIPSSKKTKKAQKLKTFLQVTPVWLGTELERS